MTPCRALAESQLPSYHSKHVPSRKGLFSLVWRGEDRDREHTPRGFLLSEDKLPHPFLEPPQESSKLKVLLALPAA